MRGSGVFDLLTKCHFIFSLIWILFDGGKVVTCREVLSYQSQKKKKRAENSVICSTIQKLTSRLVAAYAVSFLSWILDDLQYILQNFFGSYLLSIYTRWRKELRELRTIQEKIQSGKGLNSRGTTGVQPFLIRKISTAIRFTAVVPSRKVFFLVIQSSLI